MIVGKKYSTNDIQQFLSINHTATLQRLKKLERLDYLKLYVNKRVYTWEKVKDIIDEERLEGYKFFA